MKALKKMGHSVLLVCRENSKIAFEASKFGIDITFALFRNSLHIPTVWRLLGIVHSFQPDAIVCHSGHDSNIVGLVRFFTWKHPFRIIRQKTGNDSNLLIVFYVQIMPDDFVMQLHRF